MDLPGKRSTNKPSERFPKSCRLHSAVEFDAIFKSGRVLADANLVVHAQATIQTPQGASGRLGISISKRVGHAPLRNRWKRLIREAYRRLYANSAALKGLDLIVRPRRGAQPDFHAIERSLGQLSYRLQRQMQKQSSRPQPSSDGASHAAE